MAYSFADLHVRAAANYTRTAAAFSATSARWRSTEMDIPKRLFESVIRNDIVDCRSILSAGTSLVSAYVLNPRDK